MPRREDINTILVLGSGPIVIGQGCEFDYSGTQACKALREDGYRIVLVNSNPATIMTDPLFSDRTYIEPITPEAVEKIIEKEAALGSPIDAILPTLGGQTALNCACRLWDDGVIQRNGIEMIGANRDVIYRAEDRDAFRTIVEEIGLDLASATTVTSVEDGFAALEKLGLPSILRPAFTLGGIGGGVAFNRAEFEALLRKGLDASMIGQVQIDQSLLGWKEYELEVVRDRNDNCVVVCGIENIDAMGVHTGDSITVAPIQTLTDKEYQRLRDAAFKILRAVGVDTGGSNVQFAVDPKTGDMVVIEMNPRVSRSSALASKATGFPIARIAAKLAVGYTLDELRNDITGTTSACFEPTLDYVVTKMPRWAFEKFPEADETLTTQMKSVGEAMSIGRTFKESLQKAIRSMEVKRFGLGLDNEDTWLAAERGELDDPHDWPPSESKLMRKLSVPSQGRLYFVRYAFKLGWSLERINELTAIDPWFLDQIQQLVEFEDELGAHERLEDVPRDLLFRAKRLGYSDPQLAKLFLGSITTETILAVRERRRALGVEPVFKVVDTCAAEFEAITPYYYSTYESPVESIDDAVAAADDEIRVTGRPKIIILGGGPNRIGQGIEFDYCCCQAAFACGEMGFESVMINSNPETVSTDYDTSDMLFFEPLTLEDVLDIVERLNGGHAGDPNRSGGVVGVIVQYGGQTPLNLAHGLDAAGVPLIGTDLDSIDLAEDRDRFKAMLHELGMRQPESGIAYSLPEAVEIASGVGYPVMVRPSYVLGGRGMEICFDEDALRIYMQSAIGASDRVDAPILIDSFLSEAVEVDVDVVADFVTPGAAAGGMIEVSPTEPIALVCGVMEHTEEAGVHSGDSMCTIPPQVLPPATVQEIKDQAKQLAERLAVRGLMNVQMAVKDDKIYLLEVNPRASRTVPFVSKAKGVPWARVAAKVMMGASLRELGVPDDPVTNFAAVKEAVLPFARFAGVDVILGPEMRSTGEVMGIDRSMPVALGKALMAGDMALPRTGNVFISVNALDREKVVDAARTLVSMGFTVYATQGTHDALSDHSIDSVVLRKISEGARPNITDLIVNGEIHLVINTPSQKGTHTDEGRIRARAVQASVPLLTTTTGGRAAVQAIAALRAGNWGVAALQDYYESLPWVHGGEGPVAATSGSGYTSVPCPTSSPRS